jgi:hypothetical protein
MGLPKSLVRTPRKFSDAIYLMIPSISLTRPSLHHNLFDFAMSFSAEENGDL